MVEHSNLETAMSIKRRIDVTDLAKKKDDLLTDLIREICEERGQELADEQYSFGHDSFQNGRAMRGVVTRLVKEGLIKVLSVAEQDEAKKPMYKVGVSVLLTNEHGQLLLARRKNNSGAGLLSTPGGRVEYNEDILGAARREFEEETGAKLITEPRFIGWRKHNRFDSHYIMFYVHATSHTGEITNCIPDKSEDWKFYDLLQLDWQQCTEPEDILNDVMQRSKARR